MNQNVQNKVHGLIRDDLNLKNVTLEKVERKKSQKAGSPRVIIAKCKSVTDKALIMKNKSKLSKSRNFSSVNLLIMHRVRVMT